MYEALSKEIAEYDARPPHECAALTPLDIDSLSFLCGWPLLLLCSCILCSSCSQLFG